MNYRTQLILAAGATIAFLGATLVQGSAQNPFPLAAPAGVDSKARELAPPGAANQGQFNDATWKYGNAFAPPPGTKIWNPAKIKLMQGGKLVGGTVSSGIDPSTYCAMANAGYDFIWTEMQHANSTWDEVGKAWRTCPHAKQCRAPACLTPTNSRSSTRSMPAPW